MSFELDGFASVTVARPLPLGLTSVHNTTLQVAGFNDRVEIVASRQALTLDSIVGANFERTENERLANPRTLQGIGQLSPGVTENSPSLNQLVINGAFAFDNVFMVNGIDVNDNLRAQPQSLFIEDAIQETQILTSGISAEYGRFTGGVVNALTRSGGNEVSGSLRANLFNPAWTDETPFERVRGLERLDKLQASYEGTLGGPIVRNGLWFFGAGRFQKTDASNTLPVTGLPYLQTTDNRRVEVKLTGTPGPGQSLSGGYVSNRTTTANGSGALSLIIDPYALDRVTTPNWYTFANYRRVANNRLIEAQYSERRFTTGGGNGSDSLVDSPFFSVLGAGPFIWNAPFFDRADREQRNNRQLTTSIAGDWTRAGHHAWKSGYEFFRSQRRGGGSQSPTDVVFFSDFATDEVGSPVLDGGRLIPIFEPGVSAIDYTPALRGAVMNVDTNSAYAQDRWTITNRWRADLGVRYEHVKAVSTGNIIGVDNHRFMPRLATAFDTRGDGRRVVQATYGMYSGRYNEAQIGANAPVANPPELVRFYTGPAGDGRDFAPGFDLDNYPVSPDNAFVFWPPPANVSMARDLRSPAVHEWTASLDVSLGTRARADATYIVRRTTGLIEDFQTIDNGVTDIVLGGIEAGPATNSVYRNTSIARRRYQALVFQSSYDLTRRWSLRGHYTVQLRNHGNYEGETGAVPGATSPIGNFPEAFSAERFYPDGRLQSFQRHRLRVWSIYNFDLARAATVTVSGLWRVDSGRVYSLTANAPLSAEQVERLEGAGYPDFPTSNVVYFGPRGSQQFRGAGLFDTSMTVNLRAGAYAATGREGRCVQRVQQPETGELGHQDCRG